MFLLLFVRMDTAKATTGKNGDVALFTEFRRCNSFHGRIAAAKFGK
jgi:hypothetical protein